MGMLTPISDTAVSTPGDLLFHIRSERRDLNFEFEKQLLDLLGDSVKVVDEPLASGISMFETSSDLWMARQTRLGQQCRPRFWLLRKIQLQLAAATS